MRNFFSRIFANSKQYKASKQIRTHPIGVSFILEILRQLSASHFWFMIKKIIYMIPFLTKWFENLRLKAFLGQLKD